MTPWLKTKRWSFVFQCSISKNGFQSRLYFCFLDMLCCCCCWVHDHTHLYHISAQIQCCVSSMWSMRIEILLYEQISVINLTKKHNFSMCTFSVIYCSVKDEKSTLPKVTVNKKQTHSQYLQETAEGLFLMRSRGVFLCRCLRVIEMHGYIFMDMFIDLQVYSSHSY